MHGNAGERRIAVARLVPALHRQIMVAGDVPPLLSAVDQPQVESRVSQFRRERVFRAQRAADSGVIAFGENAERLLYSRPAACVARPKGARPTLRQQAAVE